MNAVNFKEQNTTIGEGQEEVYIPLPVNMNESDVAIPVTFCMEMTENELNVLNGTNKIWVTVYTFGAGFHPISLSTEKPVFPVVSGFGDRNVIQEEVQHD